MTDEINELRRQYQAIEAPPHLARRIEASLASRRPAPRSWWPAVATAAACLALLVAVPLLRQPPAEQQAAMPRTPSLSVLSRVAAARPPVSAPNLNRLRSVSPPAPPPRPALRPSSTPPSNDDMESHRMEEISHDYV